MSERYRKSCWKGGFTSCSFYILVQDVTGCFNISHRNLLLIQKSVGFNKGKKDQRKKNTLLD